MIIKVTEYESDWDSEYYYCVNVYMDEEKVIFNDNDVFVHPYTGDEIKFEDILYDGGYILEFPKDFKDIKEECLNEFLNAFQMVLCDEISLQELIESCEKHDFVGIDCDGHEHTVKAFGGICGTPFGDSIDNQIDYIIKMTNGNSFDVITADSVEEAVEKDIIEDTGDSDENTRYWVK